VLPDPFRGMGAWRNSTETQQSGHASRSGPEVKNGRSSDKDGVPEKIGCGKIQEEVSQILQRVSAGLQALHLEFSFRFILLTLPSLTPQCRNKWTNGDFNTSLGTGCGGASTRFAVN